MAITDSTASWLHRWSGGPLNYKQIYNMSFAYTHIHKKIAGASATAVLAATTGAAAAQTVTTGITNPDAPRALSVTPTANTTGSPLSVVITGVNREGKTIMESFIIPVNSTTIVNGIKSFARVTNVYIPGNTVGLTITVGTTNKLGTSHRLFNQNTTVKVYTFTTPGGALTLQAQPTVVASEQDIELNSVTPASAPDGTKGFVIAYVYDNWSDGTSVNDQPEYSTTTSTSSTSSSTSTTTITTSTSSTSISTSSTSTSTSSTSTSTSSTSTSTTTAP
jgi:hypothetical protein